MEYIIVKLLKLVIMAIVVLQTEDDKLTVNGKLVFKDTNNNWVSQASLTQGEMDALHSHLKA